MLLTARQQAVASLQRPQRQPFLSTPPSQSSSTLSNRSQRVRRQATTDDSEQPASSEGAGPQQPENILAQQSASAVGLEYPVPQQQQQQATQLRAVYKAPWDIWEFIQVAAAVWVANMAIPYSVLSAAAHLQGIDIAALPSTQRELLNLLCQLLQLGATFLIINTSISKYQPLPKPWYLFEVRFIPVFQAVATSIAAVGSGVLLSGYMTGHVDGQEEWRHLAGLHQDDVGSIALVIGALVLAPAIEEYYFRGYVLPSLTKWVHPLVAIPLTGLFFASAHPADSFLPEALLGTILSLSLLAADGNLLVPLMAHSLYNTFVLGTESLL